MQQPLPRFLLITSFLFFFSCSYSQITLNPNNFPVGGIQFQRSYAGALSIGNAGTNQVYDFSTSSPVINDTLRYLFSSQTPFAINHPGSSVAQVQPGQNMITISYFASGPNAFWGSGMTLIGDFGAGWDTLHGNNSDVDTLVATSYSYGHVETERSSLTFYAVQPLVDYKMSAIKKINVDGWGSLQLPMNSFPDVLRVKYIEYRYDTAYYMNTPVDAKGDTVYYYKYFAKDYRQPVVIAYTDSADKIQYIEYLFFPPVIKGCTDSTALNFNPIAGQDDGSCVYCSQIAVTITADTSICPGGQLTLAAAGGNSYLWSTGSTLPSISVAPTSTTVFSVYVTSTPNCHQLATVNVDVDLPVVSSFWTAWNVYTTADSILFVNTSSQPALFSWDLGDGDSSQLINPVHVYADTGTYSVRLITFNDCFSDTSYKTIKVTDPASVNNFSALNNMLSVFPNPAIDRFSVEYFLHSDAEIDLRITDALGREVLSSQFRELKGPHLMDIELPHASPGLYFISLRSGGSSVQKKLMIMNR